MVHSNILQMAIEVNFDSSILMSSILEAFVAVCVHMEHAWYLIGNVIGIYGLMFEPSCLLHFDNEIFQCI